MSQKTKLSNEQIFRALVSGDEDAFPLLVQNFSYYIINKAHIFYESAKIYGIEFCDIEQIGLISLYSSTRSYSGGNIPFAPFATTCIYNAMLNYVTGFIRHNRHNATNSVSFDDDLYDDQTNMRVSDSIGTNIYDYDLGYYNPLPIGYFEDYFNGTLTSDEFRVVEAKLQGYSYREIIKMYGFTKRQLDAIIVSLKQKYTCLFK